MRHRRAERCLLKAEAALDAGLEEEARAALAEASTLNRGAPSFEALLDAARERQAAASLVVRRARQRRVATTVLVAILGGGTWWVNRSRSASIADASPAGLTRAERSAPESVAPAMVEPSAATVATGLPDTPVETTASVVGGSSSAIGNTPPAGPSRLPLVAPERMIDLSGLRASPPPAGSVEDPVLPATPPPSVPIDRLVTGLPSAAAPSADVPPPAAAPRAAEPVIESEEPSVRAVLARFESAYSTLDADAAHAVWPGVDTRSLTRAFQSLQSQQISLGRCAISMDGATAQAECSGSATWTPRVGGGTRTEPRHWQFELSAAGGSWHIARAVVR